MEAILHSAGRRAIPIGARRDVTPRVAALEVASRARWALAHGGTGDGGQHAA